MHAMVGDRLHVHSRVVSVSDQTSEIIEIRGPGGGPPYLQAGVSLGDLAAQAGVSIFTLRKFETDAPDLAPALYAHAIAALEVLKARPPL